MTWRLLSPAAVAFLLLAACSNSGGDSRRTSFSRKLEQESEKFAQAKQQERQQQEQRRKEMEEAYRRQWQAAGGTGQPAADSGPAAAPAPRPEVQYVLSDKDLTFLVLNKLRLMQGSSSISVSCQDGKVQLFGEVDSAARKDEIVAAIKGLPGVVKVDAGELYVSSR